MHGCYVNLQTIRERICMKLEKYKESNKIIAVYVQARELHAKKYGFGFLICLYNYIVRIYALHAT